MSVLVQGLLQALQSLSVAAVAAPLSTAVAHTWRGAGLTLSSVLQVLSLAGAWRHYQQAAAAGMGGMPAWLKPAAAQQQRGLQGRQQKQQQQQQQQQQPQQQGPAPPQDLSGVSRG